MCEWSTGDTLILFVFVVYGIYSLFHIVITPPQEPLKPVLSSATTTPEVVATSTIFTVIGDFFTPHEIPFPPKDVTSGMFQTFNEDFNTFSRYVDAKGNITCEAGGKGTWQTVYNFCSRTQPSNGEEEVYIDPGFIAFLKKISTTTAETDIDNPFSISNGILAIRATPSSPQILQAVGSWAKHTSGLITTEFSFFQTYGYFEMRAKLPPGKGLWPAFWLLPKDETWPPEIDVLEAFGDVGVNGDGGKTLIHYASHGVKKIDGCGAWHDVGVDLSADFHTYGVNIEPDKITWYFDRKPYASCHPNPDTNKPFYMLINLAVGGWPGSPDANTPFPAYMYIDYVRAYQKK
jgi:beta-glucanase (GH16 family)